MTNNPTIENLNKSLAKSIKQERKRLNNKRYRENQKKLFASLQKHLSVVYILLALSVMLNLVLLTFINY